MSTTLRGSGEEVLDESIRRAEEAEKEAEEKEESHDLKEGTY